MGIDGFAVGAARAVGDPGAIAGAQNRFQRGDHAARWNDYADGLVLFAEDVHIRLAIRNNEKRLFLKFVAQADMQAFGSPK